MDATYTHVRISYYRAYWPYPGHLQSLPCCYCALSGIARSYSHGNFPTIVRMRRRSGNFAVLLKSIHIWFIGIPFKVKVVHFTSHSIVHILIWCAMEAFSGPVWDMGLGSLTVSVSEGPCWVPVHVLGYFKLHTWYSMLVLFSYIVPIELTYIMQWRRQDFG